MQLYFSSIINEIETFYLSEEESRHAISVMRHKVGDILTVIDGKGGRVHAEIIQAHPKKTLLRFIESLESIQKPSSLHIAISPTKNNDRFEWFIEKACEIGIGKITPIICQRTERTKINLERWKKIIVVSCKQAQQLYFPELMPAILLDKFIPALNPSNSFAAIINSENKLGKIDILEENTILIGPEGDFTDSEKEAMLKKGIKPISLSNSILRVETAGLVAASQWNFLTLS